MRGAHCAVFIDCNKLWFVLYSCVNFKTRIRITRTSPNDREKSSG